MSEEQNISVEVAFALPDRQAIVAVDVPLGCTALEAARLSAIASRFEEIDLDNARLGIFGKVAAATQVLKEGDRVEIYRPLIADPKEIRKARAVKAKERRATAAQ